MRVLVTGASGFAGRWLVRELGENGHEPVAPSRAAFDVRDASAVDRLFTEYEPDAVAHLAGVAYAPAANADPASAFTVNVGGTVTLLEAARRQRHPPIVLVASSSEVYARPRTAAPIVEGDELGPRSVYGLSKLGQESVAIAQAHRSGLPVIVSRAFNHTGPGQRPPFVVPAFAQRVSQFAMGASRSVRVGTLSVSRDFSDVRDTVRAYRLLIEAAADGRIRTGEEVFNVASGRPIMIADLLQMLCAIAGVEPTLEQDPDLMRGDEAPTVVGDAARLAGTTGWKPQIPLDQTLRDLWQEIAAG